jgi:hypothetical protein
VPPVAAHVHEGLQTGVVANHGVAADVAGVTTIPATQTATTPDTSTTVSQFCVRVDAQATIARVATMPTAPTVGRASEPSRSPHKVLDLVGAPSLHTPGDDVAPRGPPATMKPRYCFQSSKESPTVAAM